MFLFILFIAKRFTALEFCINRFPRLCLMSSKLSPQYILNCLLNSAFHIKKLSDNILKRNDLIYKLINCIKVIEKSQYIFHNAYLFTIDSSILTEITEI